jgi:hypothetical protein
MSAWMVTDAHVNVIVQAAIELEALPAELATFTGRMLLLENMRSLEARYGEREPIDAARLDAYAFGKPARVCTPVEVLKQIACYRYQACEHDAWEASEARAFLSAVEAQIVDAMGLTIEAAHALPGYDSAPWGID